MGCTCGCREGHHELASAPGQSLATIWEPFLQQWNGVGRAPTVGGEAEGAVGVSGRARWVRGSRRLSVGSPPCDGNWSHRKLAPGGKTPFLF